MLEADTIAPIHAKGPRPAGADEPEFYKFLTETAAQARALSDDIRGWYHHYAELTS